MVSRPACPAAWTLLGALFLFACGSGTAQHEALASAWDEERARGAVAEVAAHTLSALERRDMDRVASMVHSVHGVRFSPYAFVAPEGHVRLSAEELVEAWNDPAPRVWGYDDGTGEPIHLTLREYLERFIGDRVFSAAESIGYNVRIGRGNTVDNAAEVYPDGVVVEYHLPGTEPQYGGMDWKSLRLVFARDESQDGAWRLVAIIHDQWTI